ncbi:hypothetical protein M0804_009897 [Polistes exclamans]|nr:hypothetical protein M0804_009897 [Polistes exclamans]
MTALMMMMMMMMMMMRMMMMMMMTTMTMIDAMAARMSGTSVDRVRKKQLRYTSHWFPHSDHLRTVEEISFSTLTIQ